MIELGRSSVQAWECDVVGHLNSQYYVERAEEAAVALMARLGLPPRKLAERGLRLEATDQHMRFLAELRSWQSYSVRAGVYAVHDHGIGIYCELVADIGTRVAAAVRTEYRLRNISTGLASPLDDSTAAAAGRLAIALPRYAMARGMTLKAPIDTADFAQADRHRMRMVATGVVKYCECDQHNLMLPRFFTGHFINGITALQRPDTPFPGGMEVPGGAAVENRIIYRGWPRTGDALVIRSAITAVGDRSYNWVHWMFDLESGALLASNEAVAICVDLESRKSIPLPDHFGKDLRARANPEVRI